MRITYSNVVATLALFLALGGTSYAALKITGGNVTNGTLTGSDLKNGTVHGRDVKNASLAAADFKAGELPAGPQGPQGEPGPQGAQGETGLQGEPGATNVVARRVNAFVADGTEEDRTASCLPGEVAVGGGATITDTAASVFDSAAIMWDAPLEADDSVPEDGEPAAKWQARGVNDTGAPQAMAVVVLCASP